MDEDAQPDAAEVVEEASLVYSAGSGNCFYGSVFESRQGPTFVLQLGCTATPAELPLGGGNHSRTRPLTLTVARARDFRGMRADQQELCMRSSTVVLQTRVDIVSRSNLRRGKWMCVAGSCVQGHVPFFSQAPQAPNGFSLSSLEKLAVD